MENESYTQKRLKKRLSDPEFKYAWEEIENQLKDCNESNKHDEIDFGTVGKELL